MKTPILGSSYVLRSPNAADSRMVNLYPEIVPEGGKEAAWLQRCPGLRVLLQLPTGPVRGMWQYGSLGYAVAGSKLYRIDPDWSYHTIGTILGSGPVNMTDNGTQMFIAAVQYGYIYNNTDITLVCSTTNTSTTVTTTFTGAIWVGQPVSGTGIPTGATVASITNATTSPTTITNTLRPPFA